MQNILWGSWFVPTRIGGRPLIFVSSCIKNLWFRKQNNFSSTANTFKLYRNVNTWTNLTKLDLWPSLGFMFVFLFLTDPYLVFSLQSSTLSGRLWPWLGNLGSRRRSPLFTSTRLRCSPPSSGPFLRVPAASHVAAESRATVSQKLVSPIYSYISSHILLGECSLPGHSWGNMPGMNAWAPSVLNMWPSTSGKKRTSQWCWESSNNFPPWKFLDVPV